MKKKTTIMVEDEVTITICDNCGKEIGRSRHGEYDGYCCSLCDRSYCYDCFDEISTNVPELCMHICKNCMQASNGMLDEIKALAKQEDEIREKKFALHREWKNLSTMKETEAH